MPQAHLKGVVCCLVATLSWGAMFPVMTGALARIDPFSFTSIRYALAGAVFLALLLGREGRSGLSFAGERWLPAWIFGTAGFAGFGFLVFLGQQMAGREGALIAAIMMATQPLLGLLVSWLVRKVAPPLYSFLFMSVSFCGVALVIGHGDLVGLLRQPLDLRADGLILLGGFCWMFYTVGVTFYPRWSALKYTTVTTWLGLSSVVSINLLLFALDAVPVPSPSAVLSVAPHLAYMALVAGVLGVLGWNLGNRILSPVNGVLFINLVPLTAFAISALEGTLPAPAQLLGAGLTAIALIGNNLFSRHRLIASAPPRAPTSEARSA